MSSGRQGKFIQYGTSTQTQPVEVAKAFTKASLPMQDYGLYSSHSSGKSKSSISPLQHGLEETMAHFILHCPSLNSRSRVIHYIITILEVFCYLPTEDDEIMKAILDCLVLTWLPDEARTDLKILTRDLCEKLHDETIPLIHGIHNVKYLAPVKKAQNSHTCKSGSHFSKAESI